MRVRVGKLTGISDNDFGGALSSYGLYATNVYLKGRIVIAAGSGYGNLTDIPASLSEINSTEGTKLGGIADGATAGATWGTNLNSIPIRFANAESSAGLYLTASYMGYYSGSVWKTYMDSSGNFRYAYDANNYLEYNASANKLRGIGGGVEQWYASGVNGKFYFGGGAGVADSNGIALTSEVSWDYTHAGTSLAWYTNPAAHTGYGGAITVGDWAAGGTEAGFLFHVSNAFPSDALLQVRWGSGTIYDVWHGGNIGISIAAASYTFDKIVVGTNLATTGGKIFSDSVIQLRNNADNAFQDIYGGYYYNNDNIWYSNATHEFRNAGSGGYNSIQSAGMWLESATAPSGTASVAKIYFDGTNLKVVLSGSTKTLSWT